LSEEKKFEPTDAEVEQLIEVVNGERNLKNITMPYEVIEKAVIPEHLERIIIYHIHKLCKNNDALLHVIECWKNQGSSVASPHLTKLTKELLALYEIE
jgi:hypothetical protein